jgi:EmrB/QacA subfamily drug resistance transporter
MAEGRKTGSGRLLGAMALASGITSLPNAAIVLAIPTLHRQFGASLTELEWTVTGYLLAYSALLIAAGRLADVFGRVRVLTIGTTLYIAASVPGALAGSAVVLIVSLAAVGVGAAVLTPASLAIVTDSFRGERRGMAVGLWGASTALFSGIGPAIGGVFTAELSWRWILWLNVGVGILILLGGRGAPESRDEQASGRIDYTGLALSFAGLGALTLALNEAPNPWPFASAKFVIVLAAGVVLLFGFVLIERRLSEPLVDVRMFGRRNLSGAGIVVFVLDFAFGAVLFFIPTYLQNLLGYNALQAGLLLLPSSVTMMIAMPIGGRLFERLGPVIPIVGGMAIAGVAAAGSARVGHRYRVDADEPRRAELGPDPEPRVSRGDHHHARRPRVDVRGSPVGRAFRGGPDQSDSVPCGGSRRASDRRRRPRARGPAERHCEFDPGPGSIPDGTAGAAARRCARGLHLRAGDHHGAVFRARGHRGDPGATADPGPPCFSAAPPQRHRAVFRAGAPALTSR